MAADQSEKPPHGAHQYTNAQEIPSQISKYWHQRHKIFSKYDEGIWMTDDAWFGVTPEPVAKEIADRVAEAPASKTVLIDAFGGAGGNAIQFALSDRWSQIFVVEKNPTVLACAKHNAAIYGVAKKIWFINGDIFEVLQRQLKSKLEHAVIFGSPPWGGPTYSDHEVFDLSVMQPYPIRELYVPFSRASSHVVLFLPRTSDLRQIAQFARDERKLRVVHYCMHGSSKALCVYFGDFTAPAEAILSDH